MMMHYRDGEACGDNDIMPEARDDNDKIDRRIVGNGFLSSSDRGEDTGGTSDPYPAMNLSHPFRSIDSTSRPRPMCQRRYASDVHWMGLVTALCPQLSQDR
jgi:hypothetical protein